MLVGKAEAPALCPAVSEIVFVSSAGLQGVRRAVVGIDERALAAVSSAGKARRIYGIEGEAGRDGLIDGGEGVNPTILREVVVIEAGTGAKNRVLRGARSIGETEARGEGFAVVVWNAVDQRNVERIESLEGGILRLIAARSDEEAEGGVVTKAGIEGERWRDAPGIFGVEAEAAERLGEGAVAGIGVVAGGIGKSGGSAIEVGGELRGIVEIEGWILGELDEMFGGGSQCAAQDRFVNEIYAEANGVAAGSVRNIIAELIFLLIACDGECGDDSGELVVAKSFESGSGVKICAERKCESQAKIGVAILDVVKIAGRGGDCSSSKWWWRRYREERLVGQDRFECDCDRVRSGGTTGNWRIAPSRGER